MFDLVEQEKKMTDAVEALFAFITKLKDVGMEAPETIIFDIETFMRFKSDVLDRSEFYKVTHSPEMYKGEMIVLGVNIKPSGL